MQALKNGAQSIANKETTKAVAAPVIEGIGGCMLYIVDRYDDKGTIHDPDWEWLPGAEMMPKGFGLTFIDHLTHNVYFGNMSKWADYYERLFQFREIRYFDIKGAKTGLLSKAMTAPDGMVRIPLNESPDPKSQINEYLAAVPRRRHPAHRLLHRRHLRDDRGDARARHRIPRHAERLLRRDRPAHSEPRRRRRAHAQEQRS